MSDKTSGKKFLSFSRHDDSTTSREELVELQYIPGQEAYREQNHEAPTPRGRSRLRRSFTKFWIPEFLCWLVALGCLIAIIALLRRFDGQPIPQWQYGITLNAIVSLLATMLTFALTVPVSSCLSQLKWLHLRRERQLRDFEVIENAARGPHGAFMLLVRGGKGGLVACFGASLIVSLLAIAPFVQQIVNNTTQGVRSTGASVPVAYNYANPLRSNGIIDTDVELRMKSAIMGGLLATNTSAAQFAVPVDCSTGNCTWPDYTSLAVCTSCVDLTNSLTVSTRNSTAAPGFIHKLANGVSLATDEIPFGLQMTVNNTMQADTPQPASIAFKGRNNTILDMFVIALDNNTAAGEASYGPYAAECILEFCVQDFTATVTNGSFAETRKGEGLPVENYSVNSGSANIETKHGGRTFGVDFNTFKAFTFYLPDLFYGRMASQDGLSPTPIFPSDVTQSIWQHIKQPPHTLDSMFDNIAQSMSRAVRTDPSGSETVSGSSLVQQTTVRVHWPWISLPAAILLLCLIFLVIIAEYTRQSGLEPWKESSLAVLFHGFAMRDNGKLERLTHYDEMVDAARGMYVRLRTDDGGQVLEQTRLVS